MDSIVSSFSNHSAFFDGVKHRNTITWFFIVAIIGFSFTSTASFAKNYYGFIQYVDINSGATQIIFQLSDSKKLCKALNKNFWKGVRTTCSQCKMELSGCDTVLPSAYRDIFRDKPAIFPYVSAPYTRIVIFGVPIEKAKYICNVIAQQWRKNINQTAKCVQK